MNSLTEIIIEELENIKDLSGNGMYKKGIDQAIYRIQKCEDEAEFEEVARVMIKHLNNPKYHPHHTVIIDSTHAELNEGKQSTGPIHDYILD